MVPPSSSAWVGAVERLPAAVRQLVRVFQRDDFVDRCPVDRGRLIARGEQPDLGAVGSQVTRIICIEVCLRVPDPVFLVSCCGGEALAYSGVAWVYTEA